MQNRRSTIDLKAANLPWPHCELLGGDCIGSDLVSMLGPGVNQVLMEFIWSSAEGSRLSLQKNRQGFTVQVTGAVHRSEGEAVIDRDKFKNLKQYLDSVKKPNR